MGALPIKTDDITPVSLPALVDRAAQLLSGARTAAEVLEAREMAGFAYDMAKRQARIAKAKQAHDDVIAAAHRSQGHALEIEARAKHRLADEYDAAEPRTREDNLRRGPDVPKENVGKPTATDLGLTRPQIHAARQVRDAEKAEPGIVKRSIEEMLEAGDEPTRAHLREVVTEAAMRGLRHGGRGHSAASRRNPIHKPNPAFDAVAKLTGCCQQIVDLRQTTASSTLLSGFLDEGMRSRDLKIIRACRDSLTAFLETADAE